MVTAVGEKVRGSEFASLARRIKSAGLLERRRGYYAIKITANLAVFAGLWALVMVVGGSWWQLAIAGALGFMSGQIAFVGHDAGHRQIGRRRRSNEVLGILHANLFSGLSYHWWIGKHNRHHANPNHVDKDPDVGVGALVYTAEQAAERSGWARFLTRSQAHLFFPMCLLEGVSLHVASVMALFGKDMRRRGLEMALMAVHVVAYFGLLLLAMPPLMALAFIGVHQAVFGLYMGCSFAPNHKGMPTLDGEHALDYLRKQVLTSRNIRGGRFTDFLLGGLNYQIDHHLFPSMPRPNLRKAQPIIREFCAERGLPYLETSLFTSYADVLRHLYEVGEPLRAPS